MVERFDYASLMPIGTTVTFGGASGYAVGMFTKKVSRAATMIGGGLFVVFQVRACWFCASYASGLSVHLTAATDGPARIAQVAHKKGWVDVNMAKIEADVMGVLDTNGDGKVRTLPPTALTPTPQFRHSQLLWKPHTQI